MSDRGLPNPDGAPACPFVAFDDDRDARSTAPDHRHRCFAEQTPAPRALAHQDAYCLSSAFPVCPAFQDWARREAAPARRGASVDAPSSAAPAAASRPSNQTPAPPLAAFSTVAPPPPPPPPLPPVAAILRATADSEAAAPAVDGPGMAAWTGRPDERDAPSGARRNPPVVPVEPGRRAVPRDWAAPPPWAADDEAEVPSAPASTAIPGWGMSGGALAERTPLRGARADRPERADRVDRSRGLAGSDIERLTGPDPAGPAARPTGAYLPDGARPDGARLVRPEPPSRQPIDPAGPRSAAWQGQEPAESRDAHEPRSAAELFGPAWEQPRKFEAYPSLRTRVGIPSFAGVPPAAVGAIALLVAAAILFFVAPMLLGIGGKDASKASPSPVATVAITPTPLPTEPPGPTPTVYTVVNGDTATRIAAKFGITVDQLMAANPQVKNANKLKIGDQLVIPAPLATEVSGVPGASGSPSSAAP